MKLPEWVVAFLQNLPEQYTGRVEINFFKGGVSNVNLAQSIKEDTPPIFASTNKS